MENNFLSGVSTSKNNNIKQNAFLDDSLDNSIDDNDTSSCDVPEKNSDSSNRTKYISATSKISAELNNVWYAFSFTESREINDDSNIEDERVSLWNTVNSQVDTQVQDVIFALKNNDN